MVKRVVEEGSVFEVEAKGTVACMVGVAYRGDYEALLKKRVVRARWDGNGRFYLLEPVGSIKFLRKECVRIIRCVRPGRLQKQTTNVSLQKGGA